MWPRVSSVFFCVKSNSWIISGRVCWSLKMRVGHIWKVVYLTSGAGRKKDPMHCWTQSRQNFNEDPNQRLRWNCTRTSKEWTKRYWKSLTKLIVKSLVVVQHLYSWHQGKEILCLTPPYSPPGNYTDANFKTGVFCFVSRAWYYWKSKLSFVFIVSCEKTRISKRIFFTVRWTLPIAIDSVCKRLRILTFEATIALGPYLDNNTWFDDISVFAKKCILH